MQATALERLGTAPGGCLAEDPPPGVPAFGLDAGDRAAIGAFLQTLGSWRSRDAPILDLAADIERFSCTRCHDVSGVGGPPAELDRYFTTLSEVDAGDEGRIPPSLGGVGARLTPLWLNQVLCESGIARPYMATRMPQFGAANVGHLGPLLTKAAGASLPAGARDDGPSVDDQVAEIGRRLTGATGFNCIQCHSIAGRASTNLPGPDLVDMPERLRYGFFSQWLHDPRQIRPGTRMPTFFYGGRSGLEDLDGNADDQIAAIWGYLSQGDHLALPDGLADPGDFQVQVLDEPVVLRTFMKDTGGRAIACGFPERIHFAFDAGRCRVLQVWTGRFLNAAGVWAARGGSETDPDQAPVWVNPDTDVITLEALSSDVPPSRRFRGYRFDTLRRPTFQYEITSGDTVVHVSESPVPTWTDGRPSLQRRFELDGPPGGRFIVHAAGHRFLETGETTDEPVGRTLDANGTARFTLELTW
jgi:mono/diheme cytochrome c family protein